MPKYHRLLRSMYRIWLEEGSRSDSVIKRSVLLADDEAKKCLKGGGNEWSLSKLRSKGWVRMDGRCTYHITDSGKVEAAKLQLQ